MKDVDFEALVDAEIHMKKVVEALEPTNFCEELDETWLYMKRMISAERDRRIRAAQ